jgi:formylglycine-generating enzyme required for sulfatase activity
MMKKHVLFSLAISIALTTLEVLGYGFIDPKETHASDWSVSKPAGITYHIAPIIIEQQSVNETLQDSGEVDIPSVAPDPALTIGSTQVSVVDGMTMVYVPEGEFIMGSSTGYKKERPEHTVYLDAYWIDKTLVTNNMYINCVVSGGCTPPLNVSPTKYGHKNSGNYPVVYVSWQQAHDYCKWAGRRLPTEAEWEKAARGVDGRIYPWGNDAPDCQKGNFKGCSEGLSVVDAYPQGASPYGALDMAGNVWQWVADFYGADYYSISPYANPQGPESSEYYVLRGGAWNYGAERFARTFTRLQMTPTHRATNNGFRCALSAGQ